MAGLGPRLVVYGFFGAFGVVGLVFLLIALSTAVHRVEFIHAAQRTEGTVIEMRPTHHSRYGAGSMFPVFRFTAGDGLMYMVVSDVYVRPTAFRVGERVTVLYMQGHPETARIDAFTPLWLSTLVPGIVGAAFFCVPGLLLLGRFGRRQKFTYVESL